VDNEDIELTEMVDLNVSRQDGVVSPASGFGFLVKKSAEAAKDVNAQGGIDEQPDIDGARGVLCALYKLIEQEAREGAVGADESYDIQCLSEAICLVKYFLQCELDSGMEDDGSGIAKSEALAELDQFVVAKAHRKFSSDERKRLASEGNALEDGSYPIPDADALHRAAILARSGHGDVAAAKRLIAKRAKELGVSNPLAESKATKMTDDTTTTSEPEVSEGSAAAEKSAVDALVERVEKMESALAETSQLREDNDKLSKELEVLKATPIPGGPALSATAEQRALKAKSDLVQKAAYYRRLSEQINDRELSTEYDKRARALEAEAA
jgi:hypothetical protein